jgi:xanthine dehydrogenase accessory factor
MTDELLAELLAATGRGERCALVTVAATKGSVPREAGAKAIVYEDGHMSGTIGGGKFEALVIADALAALEAKQPALKTYPLHEASEQSFGAICGGEATMFIEPHTPRESLVIIGAGHCAQAIAQLAGRCGLHVTAIDDRSELLPDFPAHRRVSDQPATEFIAQHHWRADEALVIVNRNAGLDRDALHAALQTTGWGYLGMMGSRRKVRMVFDELRAAGISDAQLDRVFAPLGLDLGADSPAEIAVSIVAEILRVLRDRTGRSLRDSANPLSRP